MAKSKNESIGEMALRYGKAFLFKGGVFGIGQEAYNDVKNKEKQAIINELFSRIENAFDNEDYGKVVNIANLIIDQEGMDEDAQRIAKWYKAKGFLLLSVDENNEQSCDTLTKAEDLFYDYGNEYGWDEDVVYMIMLIDDCLERIVNTRNEAIFLLNSDDRDYRTEAIKLYDKYTNILLEHHNFTEEIPYSERKYIFIGQNTQKIGGAYQWIDDKRVIDWIFTLDKLPSDIVLPLGRPQPGLYLAHPANTNHYYPMKNAEETLFMDKVREFCWLVQCLGANEVSFHSNKGLSISQGMGSSMNVGVDVGVNAVNVGGSYGNTRKRDDAYNYGQQVELVQHFAPKKKAYCPNDLIWLDSDPEWRRLIKQRLQGGFMEYNYKISSSETCQMTTNETNEVKANFEYIMYKVNANYDSSTDQTFSKTKETEWAIHVEFVPLEELTEETTIKLTNRTTEKEQDYLDMLKESMGDGEITPRERKMLERVRASFGISEERAKELEMALLDSNKSNNIDNASKTTAMIDCFINNLSDILINTNYGDNMYPRISDKTQTNITLKFGLKRNEAILFYRNSGILFKKYTMVLTDKGVYYKDENKQTHSFAWKDVSNIQCESTAGNPEYVDFHFTTSQGEHVIFMIEFGIINKEEIDKYLEPIKRGLIQMANTAKKYN